MREIILNEKSWAENAIYAHSFFGSPARAINNVARYYYSQGYRNNKLRDMIERYAVRCDPDFPLVRYDQIISKAIVSASKYALSEIQFISVTQKELDVVESRPTMMQRRLLFTLIVLAKYYNAHNEKNNNWVCLNQSDIFALANIKVSDRRKALLINDLWSDGLIEYGANISNVNIHVMCVDDGEPVMHIDDTRNLGNQYMMHIGCEYMQCDMCGIVVKKTSNRQKYCNDCAQEMRLSLTQK